MLAPRVAVPPHLSASFALSQRFFMEEFKSGSRESVDIPCPGLHVEGEVKMTLYDRTRVAKRKLFHFWFHTAFVDGMALRLSKAEIDGCHRDTHHRVFGEGFSVLLEFGPAMETASNGAASRASIAGEEMETVAVSGPDGGEGAAADADAAPGCRGDMVAPMPVDGESDTDVTGTEDDGVGEAEAGAAGAPAQG